MEHDERDGAVPRRPARVGAQLPRADGSPVRVLVVDDEPSLAELLASVLRYEGWEIRTAADGGQRGPGGPGVPSRTPWCST